MKLTGLSSFPAKALLVSAIAISASLPVHADTISWTDWTSSNPGNPVGSANGSIAGGPTVAYTGQINDLFTGAPTWGPASMYTGGIVGNAPTTTDGMVAMVGGSSVTESIVFSSAVVNPVIAIFSLGAPGVPASFDFTAAEPFTVVAGGPSTEFGGSSVVQVGTSVSGQEGNGVIVFSDTYTEIDFTTPTYENYFGFTVGDDTNPSDPPAPTPEPETLTLFGFGLVMLPFLRSSFARRQRA
jgi:hypothetical protein